MLGGGALTSRSQSLGRARWKEKSLKALDQKRRFFLGHDVYLDKVDTLCRRALIGRQE